MDYSECLDMMRHQIIMLQERKAPVNVVDNPKDDDFTLENI